MASFFPHTAMIFAAGFGKRMLPLTAKLPKPLITVKGKTLLSYAIDNLVRSGIERIVINTHYLAEHIHHYILQHDYDAEIILSHEETILETGGGIVHALPHLGDQPFFTINSDAIWVDQHQPALHALARCWRKKEMDAVLLLQPTENAVGYDGPGDFFLEDSGVLRFRGEADYAPYVYTGIQLISPHVFSGMKPTPFSLRDIYARGILHGVVHDGQWLHVGTVDGIRLAEEALQG